MSSIVVHKHDLTKTVKVKTRVGRLNYVEEF